MMFSDPSLTVGGKKIGLGMPGIVEIAQWISTCRGRLGNGMAMSHVVTGSWLGEQGKAPPAGHTPSTSGAFGVRFRCGLIGAELVAKMQVLHNFLIPGSAAQSAACLLGWQAEEFGLEVPMSSFGWLHSVARSVRRAQSHP